MKFFASLAFSFLTALVTPLPACGSESFLYRSALELDPAGSGYKPSGWTDYTSEWHTCVTKDHGYDGSQGLRITLTEEGLARKERGVVFTGGTFGSDFVIDVDARPLFLEGRRGRLVFILRFDPQTKNTYARLSTFQKDGQSLLTYQEVIKGIPREKIALDPIPANLWDGKFRHWQISVRGRKIVVNLADGGYLTSVPESAVTLFRGNFTIGFSTGVGDVADYDNIFVSDPGRTRRP